MALNIESVGSNQDYWEKLVEHIYQDWRHARLAHLTTRALLICARGEKGFILNLLSVNCTYLKWFDFSNWEIRFVILSNLSRLATNRLSPPMNAVLDDLCQGRGSIYPQSFVSAHAKLRQATVGNSTVLLTANISIRILKKSYTWCIYLFFFTFDIKSALEASGIKIAKNESIKHHQLN